MRHLAAVVFFIVLVGATVALTGCGPWPAIDLALGGILIGAEALGSTPK